MKNRIAFLLIILSAFLFPAAAFGYDIPKTVRVGLEYKYKEVSSVPVLNTQIGAGYEEDGQMKTQAVFGGGGFAVSMPEGYYVDTKESYPNYEVALYAAEALVSERGFDAVPVCFTAGGFGVYVSGIADSSLAYAVADGLLNDYGLQAAVRGTEGMLEIKKGSAALLIAESGIQIAALDKGGIIDLNGRSYRGIMEFGRYNGSLITAVNVVDLEEYLYSVVPSEMPTAWPEEALKAQAVAARTYALSRMGVHSADGYEICDTINCQAYLGYTNESPRTAAAVDATRGILIYFNDKPINAVFCSSSGGYTDNSENAWTETVPYLRAVPDTYEASASWTRTFSAAEIRDMLFAAGVDIGSITNMAVTKYQYGRAQEITFAGTSGQKSYTRESIRTIFSYSADGSLASRMFTINGEAPAGDISGLYSESDGVEIGRFYVLSSAGSARPDGGDTIYVMGGKGETASYSENTGKVTSGGSLGGKTDTFVISGKGNGHGVGLSQYGAKGMAEAGFGFEEILTHYYTDVKVE